MFVTVPFTVTVLFASDGLKPGVTGFSSTAAAISTMDQERKNWLQTSNAPPMTTRTAIEIARIFAFEIAVVEMGFCCPLSLASPEFSTDTE